MSEEIVIDLSAEELAKVTAAAAQCSMSPEDFALWAAVSRAESWLDQP